MYAGFGDGLSFAPWILIHIERKALIDLEEMEAIARVGAAECLASGVTTIGDASYVGATATACHELGLRATVFLEVFGTTTEQLGTRFEENRARIEPAALRSDPARHLSARAVLVLARALRRLPRARGADHAPTSRRASTRRCGWSPAPAAGSRCERSCRRRRAGRGSASSLTRAA